MAHSADINDAMARAIEAVRKGASRTYHNYISAAAVCPRVRIKIARVNHRPAHSQIDPRAPGSTVGALTPAAAMPAALRALSAASGALREKDA